MGKNHTPKNSALIVYLLFVLFAIASCKKDNTVTKTTPVTPTPLKIGLDEYYLVPDSTTYKILGITIQTIGTKAIDEDWLFDTGSGGLVVDGHEVLPASMITSTGFNFTGDSTVVNGITITSQKDSIPYGDDATSGTTAYGNLAYASVTIGQTDGSFTIKRLPFFIYYKANDYKNNPLPVGELDIFGASTEYDVMFANNVSILSPFSYYEPGTGLTKGFKMSALGTTHFSDNGTYVPGVISLGLTAADVSSTSGGFKISNISNVPDAGYVPAVKGTITYNGKELSSYMLFDTGTEPVSIIEDNTGPTFKTLASGSTVSLATSSGFNFSYTTTDTEYITQVENPNSSQANVSIFGLEFFLTNSYLLDYADNLLGVKND